MSYPAWNACDVSYGNFQVLPTVQLEAGYFLPTECRNLLLRTAPEERELAGIAELLKCTLSVENLVIDLSAHNSFLVW